METGKSGSRKVKGDGCTHLYTWHWPSLLRPFRCHRDSFLCLTFFHFAQSVSWSLHQCSDLRFILIQKGCNFAPREKAKVELLSQELKVALLVSWEQAAFTWVKKTSPMRLPLHLSFLLSLLTVPCLFSCLSLSLSLSLCSLSLSLSPSLYLHWYVSQQNSILNKSHMKRKRDATQAEWCSLCIHLMFKV